MVVLGVVLVLLALAVGVLLVAGVASLDSTVDVSVPGGTLHFPPLTFLVTGMVVISVFWLGWVVLRTGVRRSRRQRAEAKEAAREAEVKRAAEEQRLKEEFAARERQLIEERRRHDSETAELKRDAVGGSAVASGTAGADPADGGVRPPGRHAPASPPTTRDGDRTEASDDSPEATPRHAAGTGSGASASSSPSAEGDTRDDGTSTRS
jgi:hypothetical protein